MTPDERPPEGPLERPIERPVESAAETPAERAAGSPIDWPVATLDPIGRAKILASAIPSAAWAEGVIEAPFAETWGWITDFERSVPRFDTDIESIAVHGRSREGNVEHVRLTARSHGVPVPFDVRLEEGFCLMRGRARVYLVVMAAQPAGDYTRFLHLEAIPLPGTRFLHSRLQRMVNADLRRLSNVARHGF